ncbi:MAG: allene oxide cyclase barrel-like domain-containing protein [Gammaproteobacteria bacterium]
MRRSFTVGVVAAIALSLGLAASAFAGRSSGKKTIVLFGDHAGPDTLGLDTHIEAGNPDGVGDQDLFSDDLRDSQGNVAGRNSGVCITTSPFVGDPDRPLAHRGANLCTLGFVLEDGKITVSGIVTDDDFAAGGFTLPITGGTGDFRRARGEFEVKFAPVFTDPARLTFKLTGLARS